MNDRNLGEPLDRLLAVVDVAHDEQDADVVAVLELLDALVDVVGMQAVVSDAAMSAVRSSTSDAPEEEHACRRADLVVARDLAVLPRDVADAGVDDRVALLAGVDDDS